ncbi:MAG: hypothetical protein M1834_002959 [Cirrosporium novae-zelandiae]|nr:MAG: hypothetical protein M1834_002959 [Cirrosporium novae-zelandiae]
MNNHDDQKSLVFYPAYCWPAAPTYDNSHWVKLTADDVHNRLTTRPASEGQNTYFYLNYPIRYFCLQGLLVSITFYPRRLILTLDDFSGYTIDLVAPLPAPASPDPATDILLPEPTNTINPNPSVTENGISLTGLETGTLIKAKGTISVFRHTRQIALARLTPIVSTTSELASWRSQTQFYKSVLSHPWVLSEAEQNRLRDKFAGDQSEQARKARRKKVREEKRRRVLEQRCKRGQKEYEREQKLFLEDERVNALDGLVRRWEGQEKVERALRGELRKMDGDGDEHLEKKRVRWIDEKRYTTNDDDDGNNSHINHNHPTSINNPPHLPPPLRKPNDPSSTSTSVSLPLSPHQPPAAPPSKNQSTTTKHQRKHHHHHRHCPHPHPDLPKKSIPPPQPPPSTSFKLLLQRDTNINQGCRSGSTKSSSDRFMMAPNAKAKAKARSKDDILELLRHRNT